MLKDNLFKWINRLVGEKSFAFHLKMITNTDFVSGSAGENGK